MGGFWLVGKGWARGERGDGAFLRGGMGRGAGRRDGKRGGKEKRKIRSERKIYLFIYFQHIIFVFGEEKNKQNKPPLFFPLSVPPSPPPPLFFFISPPIHYPKPPGSQPYPFLVYPCWDARNFGIGIGAELLGGTEIGRDWDSGGGMKKRREEGEGGGENDGGKMEKRRRKGEGEGRGWD